MSNFLKRLSTPTALLMLCTALPQSAFATPLVAPIDSGGETPLAHILKAIMKNDGVLLNRIIDDKDELWALAGDGTVRTRARFSGNNNTFGVLPGTGSPDKFQKLVSSLSDNGIADSNGAATFLPDLVGDFRLAIRTPLGQVWSSRAADNIDSKDHMMTWVDAKDPLHYFVGFEELNLSGSSGDFNDVVLELHNVLDGPISIPEPSTYALFSAGLAGLLYFRQNKRPAIAVRRRLS